MKKILSIAVVITLFAASSCTKEENIGVASTNSDVKEMLAVLKASGVDLNTVKVDEKQKFFLVEGDIAISFKDIPAIKEAVNREAGSLEKAYRYPNPYYASLSAASSIDIYIDPSINANGWQSAVNTAISAWNSVSPNCAVRIATTTNSSTADLRISAFTDNTSIVAVGNAPSNGAVGRYINVNTSYNYLNESTKINTIVHEIGHTVGLAHTNGQSNFCTPVLIPGTSSYNDPNAVMYPYIHAWNGFSADEVSALNTLFYRSTTPSISIRQSPYVDGGRVLTTNLSFSVENISLPVTVEKWYGSPNNDGNYSGIIGTDEIQTVRFIKDPNGNNSHHIKIVLFDSNGRRHEATRILSTFEKCEMMMLLPVDPNQ